MKRLIIYLPLLIAADWFLLDRFYTREISEELQVLLRYAPAEVSRMLGH